MITHVVMFKLKDNSPAGVDDAVARLRSMAGKMDVLRDIEVGADFMHSARSYDIVLITRFDSRAALEEYAAHPLHQPVLAYMREAAAASVAVDYES